MILLAKRTHQWEKGERTEGNSVCSLYGAVLQDFSFFFNELVNNTKGKNWWPPVCSLVYIFFNCKRASYKARNTTYLSHPHSQNLANSMFQQVSWWLWHLKTRTGWTPSSKSILGGAEIAKKCNSYITCILHIVNEKICNFHSSQFCSLGILFSWLHYSSCNNGF